MGLRLNAIHWKLHPGHHLLGSNLCAPRTTRFAFAHLPMGIPKHPKTNLNKNPNANPNTQILIHKSALQCRHLTPHRGPHRPNPDPRGERHTVGVAHGGVDAAEQAAPAAGGAAEGDPAGLGPPQGEGHLCRGRQRPAGQGLDCQGSGSGSGPG